MVVLVVAVLTVEYSGPHVRSLQGQTNEANDDARPSEAWKFIAVGTEPVYWSGVEVGEHYSLQLWECSEQLKSEHLYDTDGFSEEQLKALCGGSLKLDETVELLIDRNRWEAWAWLYRSFWYEFPVSVAYVETKRRSRPDRIMPIRCGSVDAMDQTWDAIKVVVQEYQFAEPVRPQVSQDFVNWPYSLYQTTGNNSNTFIRWVVRRTSGLEWTEMTGPHPGAQWPKDPNSRNGQLFSERPPHLVDEPSAPPAASP